MFVDDETAAARLLDLAGFNQEQRHTRVRWGRLAFRLAAGALGWVLGSCIFLLALALPPNSGFGLIAFACPFFLAGVSSRRLVWREVQIGTDGFVWQGKRRHFIPLRDIEHVSVRAQDLVIRLVTGEVKVFTVNADDRGLVSALKSRLEKALEDVGLARGKERVLARGNRTFAEWLEAARGTLKTGRGFREVALDAADLLAILADPVADPESRVGAALALQQTQKPEYVQKVRVAAESCASPKLRVVLEQASKDEVVEFAVQAAQREHGLVAD